MKCAYCHGPIKRLLHRSGGEAFCSKKCAADHAAFLEAMERYEREVGAGERGHPRFRCDGSISTPVTEACAKLGVDAPRPGTETNGAWVAAKLAEGIEAGQWDLTWGRE